MGRFCPAVGQWANFRSCLASSWLPRLSWVHVRKLYYSGSCSGYSSMKRFTFSNVSSHSGVGSCVSAIARWPYPMWCFWSSSMVNEVGAVYAPHRLRLVRMHGRNLLFALAHRVSEELGVYVRHTQGFDVLEVLKTFLIQLRKRYAGAVGV